MVDLTRRGFLQGLVAVGTVAGLGPLAVKDIPTLWGDGIHDDTEALQALFDGKQVIQDGTVYARASGGSVFLRGGTYLVSNTLKIGRNGHRTSIDHTTWRIPPDYPAETYLFDFRPPRR